MTLESEPIDDLGNTGRLPDEPEVTEDAKEQESAEGEVSKETPPEGQEAAKETVEEAGDADEGEDTGEEDAEPEPSKRRRPGKAARKITRLEAELTAANERLARLEGAASVQQQEPAPAEPKAPREEDFEDRGDFIVATAKHEARQEARREFEAERANREKDRQTEQMRERAKAFTVQVEAARDAHEDYDEVVFANDLRITQSMFQIMSETDRGAEIAYALGNNPQEASRIAGLSPVNQALELGKIEARLDKPSLPKKPTATPDPAKKVKPSVTPAKSLENQDYGEYVETRRKQMAASRR